MHMRAWLWKHGRSLAPSAALVLVAFVPVGLLVPGSFLRGVVVGTAVTFTAAMLLFASLVGSNSMRFFVGSLGEEATEELFTARDRRRDGWKLVNGLVVNGRDIDHIAVGLGGVLAIESKWRGSEQSSKDWALQSRRQAMNAARTTRNLIRQEAGILADVLPVLIEWGPGAPDRSFEEIDGVFCVSGHDLASFDEWLATERLQPERVSFIATALAQFLDAQIDIVSSGGPRRTR